ncbi:MAG: type VII secretion integral membrane protein EccD [Pseudonocardiales bacterium]|nr:type VII secretion integral membrane protein EccD [Pseudonocardiales bacterium]MBV9032349.1 type VII secretion integral membrane protein EccD [Pseudonocardiales bacterium]MBW0010838.1 type VII secretion integral membrane protein EccD [Pseudonocardiales bacterium]
MVGAKRGAQRVPTHTNGTPTVPPSGAGPTVPPSTVFSRVTVVAPRTRIDVALPSDVAVAHILPMLLTMAGESSPDGGSRHGGWCLTRLGGEAIDPDRPLSSLGVLDGDLLQLRHRSDSPPPPLFDDVVEAIAVAAPDSYRPWTESTARTLGTVAAGLAMLASAVALLRAGVMAGPDHHGGIAVLASAAAVVALTTGVVVARVYGETDAGVVVAAGSLPLGFVGGLYLVPGGVGRENLLLACTLALVLATASIMMLGVGVTPLIACATAATLGALAFLLAILVERPAAGIAAGAAAGALGGISILPRLTIHLSRLPIPQVPGSAKDLQEDSGFPDYTAIERRAGLAHEYLTGMIMGSGAVAAIGAVLAAAAGALGMTLGAVVAVVLLLRARSYANGNQAIALLVSGMVVVAGLMARLLASARAPGLLLVGFGGLLVLATLALVTGVALPHQRFSPVLRRSVDVVEAALIAAVLPLALGVLDLYHAFRTL